MSTRTISRSVPQTDSIRHALHELATDTLIVKLKGSARVGREPLRVGAARRGLVAERRSVLDGLLADGFVAEAAPVFGGREPFAMRRTGARAAAVAAAERMPPTGIRRARGLTALRLDPGVNAADLARHLESRRDEFEYAFVPAVKYPLFAASRRRKRRADPHLSRQWGHAAVRIHEARARARFKDAQEVPVAVVDSGIDDQHPDLKASIREYRNFHSASEGDQDYSGHGTHVSGIIAATINNGIGIAGLCRAPIVAIKGLPRRTWNAARYYQALAYPMEAGAKVVNMSLGGDYDRGEKEIIEDLLAAGIVVVAAMGNEFEEGNATSYPAAYAGVIAVGATDEADRRASFSCTGRHIAVSAPGERILSTVPRYPSSFASRTSYDSWPGTSMACPHVAAAVALLLAKKPGLSPAQVRTKIMASADRVGGQTGWTRELGAGRLNIAKLLA